MSDETRWGLFFKTECVRSESQNEWNSGKGVQEWPPQKFVEDIQRLSGLAGYHRKLVEDFAKLARQISDLVLGHRYEWKEEQKNVFEGVKNALVAGHVLVLPRIEIPLTSTTDASRYAIWEIMEQDGHTLEYISHRLTESEKNLYIGDQELLAFTTGSRNWEVSLSGATFKLNTDHEPIRYLLSMP